MSRILPMILNEENRTPTPALVGIKERRGPGGHIPDGTGPHGQGMGPGKGQKDGSGLRDKGETNR